MTQVTPAIRQSANRRALRIGTALATGVIGILQLPGAAWADDLPTGGIVVSGGPQTSIGAQAGNTLPVTVGNGSSVITWESFSVADGFTVAFNKGNGNAARSVLNRVIGDGVTVPASIIDGAITSDPEVAVWLVNRSGITFSSTGSFNGGSLVLSTLGVTDPQFASATPQFTGTTAGNIGVTVNGSLTTNPSGGNQAAGAILIVGQKIDLGGTLSAKNDIGIVAASDVTFTSGVGSPLAFTINAGTALTGISVGTGTLVSGANVTLAAVSKTTALNTLLSMSAGTIEAKADGGAVVLTTATGNGVTVTPTTYDDAPTFTPIADGISLTGGTIKTANATDNGSVVLRAAGAITSAGTVTAKGTGTYSATAKAITIGGSGTVTQNGGSGIALTATGTPGTISTLSGATLTTSNGATNDIVLDAAGAATLGGTVTSGGNYKVTAASVGFTGSTQQARGNIDVTTSAGAITATSGTTLIADSNTNSTGDLYLDSFTTITLAQGSQLTAADTAVGLRYASGSAVSLGNVTATSLGIAAPLVLGVRAAVLGTKLGGTTPVVNIPLASLTAGTITLQSDLSVETTGAISAQQFTLQGGSGNLSLVAGGDITGLASAPATTGNSDNNFLRVGINTSGNAVVTSNGLVQAGTVASGGFATLSGGKSSVPTANGKVDVTSVTAAGNVSLVAWSNSAADSAHNGDILVGTASSSGGAVSLNNTAGGATVGNVTVGNKLTASDDVTVNSVGTINTAAFSAPSTGVITSSAGNIQLIGGGAVTLPSQITANGTLAIQGDSVALGGVAAATQSARGTVSVTAVTGAITGTSTLTLSADTNSDGAVENLSLTAVGASGAIDFALGSQMNAGVSGNYSDVALGYLAGSDVKLGDVTARSIIKSGGSTLDNLRDLIAGTLTYTANLDVNATRHVRAVRFDGGSASGNLSVVAGGSITGIALGSPVAANTDPNFGRINLDPGGTLTVTAGGLVQGNTFAADAVTVTAGSSATPSNGKIDITTINATAAGTVGLTAWSASGADSRFNGDILVNAISAQNAVTLDNNSAGAASGNIVIGNKIVADGSVTIDSINSVLLAQYVESGPESGFIRATDGNILITARRSVYGIGGSATDIVDSDGNVITTRGSIGYEATGNITINGTGDLITTYIKAGGSLDINITGGIYGGTGGGGGSGTPPTPKGGALFASKNGAGVGSISVYAGTDQITPVTDVISLAKVKARDDVILSADLIAVGSIEDGPGGSGTTTLLKPDGSANTTDVFGGVTVLDDDGLGNGTITLAGPISYSNIIAPESTNKFEGTLGYLDLEAGANIIINTDGYAAQLGQVKAGAGAGTIDVTAGGIVVAGALSAGSNVNLTTAPGGGTFFGGTLALPVATGTIGGALTLNKTIGLFALGPASNDLRVFNATSAGTMTLTSATSVRVATARSTGGALNVTATGGDVSGLLVSGSLTSLGDVTTGTEFSANYGRATLTASTALTVSAVNGSAQLGNLVSNGSIAVSARGVTIDDNNNAGGDQDANAGTTLSVTATAGTLHIAQATSGGTFLIDKQGASDLLGNELRVTTISGGTSGGALVSELKSSGYVRIGSATASSGTLQITADSDVSGLQTGAASLLFVGTSDTFGATYGRANLTATTGAVGLTSNRVAQIGTVTAGTSINLSAPGLSVTTANAGTGVTGTLTLSSTLGTLTLGTGTAGGIATITRTVNGGGYDGDEIRIGSLTAGTNAGVSTSAVSTISGVGLTRLRATTIDIQHGDLSVNMGGDITGLWGGVAGTYANLGTVTTGTRFTSDFGLATITVADDSTIVSAASAQFARVATTTGSLSVSARGLTVDNGAAGPADASAGLDLSLTATLGTLHLSDGTAGRTVQLTKQGGAIATAGDELRVTTITGGTAPGVGGVTLTSNTHVRAQTVTATRGTATINTTLGDVTGLLTGSTQLLSLDVPGIVLSSQYGAVNVTSTAGSISIGGARGVQAGSLIATGGGVGVTAQAMGIATATAGNGQLTLTSTVGTLALTTGTSTDIATIDKQGATNELRIGSLTAASSVAVLSTATSLVRSATSVRAGTAAAQHGNLTVTATAGDVSGLLTGTAGAFGSVTTGEVFSAAYGRANLSAANDLTINALAGSVQLGNIVAGNNLTINARGVTIDDDDDTVGDWDATAGGLLSITATLGTLNASEARSTAGAVSLTKQNGALATDGDDLRVRVLTGATGVTILSNTSLRAGTVTATAGLLDARATLGDISGFKTGAAFGALPIVTTGLEFSPDYGGATFVATAGSIDTRALNGAIQLDRAVAGTNISVQARGIAIDDGNAGVRDVDAGGTVSLTATAGTLTSDWVRGGGTVTLDKQGGNPLTVGDELRVRLIDGGGASGLSLTSSTSIRTGAINLATGNVVLTASAGDISGMPVTPGVGAILPTVTTGTQLSAVYGKLDVTTLGGSIGFTAGRGAQFGALSATTTITGSAGGLTADSAGAPTVDITATSGTLYIGSATAGTLLKLTKQNGALATDGDDLRITTGSGGAVTLLSSTSIRAGTVTATTGLLSVTATNGDISGFKTGAAGALPIVTTGDVFSANYGKATLAATAGSIDAKALNGAVQLARATAGTNVAVQALGIAIDDGNAGVRDVDAGGTVNLTATNGTLTSDWVRGGGTVTLTKQGGNPLTVGDELRVRLIDGGGASGLSLTSSTSIRTGAINLATGNVSLTATAGDISGMPVTPGVGAILPTVTTGTQLSAVYGKLDVTTSSGSIGFTAGRGAQFGDLSATTTITGTAGGFTADSAGAATIGITATAGTLYIGSAIAGATLSLTKQNGAVATDGDDLRVTTGTGGTGVTLLSNTSIRAGTVTASTGNVSLTTTIGDVSGFKTGTAGLIPNVSTGTALSTNYGLANVAATTGNVVLAIANVGPPVGPGGSAQFGTLQAGGSVTGTAKSLSATTLTAGSFDITATVGTLAIGTATANTGLAKLSKAGGSSLTDGDDLRVATITGQTGVQLASTTSIRVNSATATTGAISAIASFGAISGFKTGAFQSSFPISTTGTVLSTDYGKANLTANGSGGAVTTQATNSGIQLGTINTVGAFQSTSAGFSADTAGAGSISVTAGNFGTLYLGSGTATTTAVLTKNGAIDGDGLDLRVTTLTAGTGATLTSATSIRAGTITANTGNVSLTTTAGDVSGFKTGTFAALPTVSTAASLSANYGLANVAATTGNVTLSIGNGAQFGTLSTGSAGSVTGTAKALTATTLTAGSFDITASVGTMAIGTASATSGLAKLTKSGGSVATDGDDLRVTTLTGQTGVSLLSSTSIRAGTVTATTGALSATATAGDVSGFKTGAPFGVLPLVTTGTVLSANYGKADFSALAGSAAVTALAGGAQLGTIGATTTTTVNAGAITVDTASANGALSLTAGIGTLYAGLATGGTVALTKNAGAIATDGDDLRVTTATGGSGVTILSNTSIRAGTVTATTGALSATATLGDISGFKTGAAGPLGTVSLASDPLGAGYGRATFTATTGAQTLTANAGGVQAANLVAGTDLTVTARALTIDDGNNAGGDLDATAGHNLTLTATAGTLQLSAGQAGNAATLVKQGGSAATAGDDLRVHTLTAGAAAPGGILDIGGATLTSSTSVRTDTTTATRGDVAVTATAGDVSGLLLVGQTDSRLPLIALGDILGANYGRATLTSTAGNVTLSALSGGAQLATVTAAGSIGLSADALTVQGATATTGSLSLLAELGTLHLTTGSANTLMTLTKQGGSAATAGDELRAQTITGGTGVALTSSTSVRTDTATATTGGLSVTATAGDISGFLSGASGALPLVTTTGRLSTDYGLATLTAAAGAIGVTAGGGAQFALLDANTTLTGSAAALTATTAKAGSALDLTATTGTLFVGTGTSGTTAKLTKTGGSVGTDGDDLRVTSLTSGQAATLASSTSIRIGTLVATTGAVSLTTTAGDISGFKTGAFGALPTVSTGPELSTAYALADVKASSGAVTFAAGNGAQFGTIEASGAITGTATALSATTVKAGTSADLTASAGTMALGTLTSGTTTKLTKTGGSTATDGDDLRVSSLTSGQAVTIASSTSVRIGSATATSGALQVTATAGDVSGFKTGAFGALPTVSTAAVLSAAYGNANLAASGGAVSVTAGNGAQLGTVTASGAITVGAKAISVASAGAGSTLDLTASTGTLTLTAGTAGSGATLTKQAGAITTDGDDLRIGTLTAATGVTLLSSTSIRAGSVTATTGNLTATATNGDISGAKTGTAGALPGVSLGTSLSANYGTADLRATAGNLTANAANGGVQLGTAVAGQAITASARALTIGTATAGTTLGLTATVGTLALGTGTAGTTATLTKTGGLVATSGDEMRVGTLTAATDATLATSTSARIGSLSTTNGKIAITATAGDVTGSRGASTGTSDTAMGRATLTARTDLTVTAGGLVQGGAVTATTGALAITAGDATRDGSIDLASAKSATTLGLRVTAITPFADSAHDGDIRVSGLVDAGTTLTVDNTLNSGLASGTGGEVQLNGGAKAAGAVSITALEKITLGSDPTATYSIDATGQTVALAGKDLDVARAVKGTTITVTDRYGSANALRIGGSPEGTGGFVLDDAELDRLQAATVTLDAWTTTGQTQQNVAIGALTIDNAITKVLNINGAQRFDLTGNIVSTQLTDLRLGGSSTDANRQAKVLRAAAKADGTGARFDLGGTAKLEFRAEAIGVGQDAGFLSALGVTSGGTPNAPAATQMNTNPGSALYFAARDGGAIYAANDVAQTLISTGSLTVRYSTFALIQNTALLGTGTFNSGVLLASITAPAVTALSISGPATGSVGGPFALFGKINGVADTAAALLGATVLQVQRVDLVGARVNGCLIGSGAGCLSTPTLVPSLGAIAPNNGNLFTVNTDFILPFDPLVGTNNDSLFGDVGTLGIGDIPLAPLDCTDPKDPSCEASKQEQSK